jgi:hypothetical protein
MELPMSTRARRASSLPHFVIAGLILSSLTVLLLAAKEKLNDAQDRMT